MFFKVGPSWLGWWTLLKDIEEQQKSYFRKREKRKDNNHRHINWWNKQWSWINQVAIALWHGNADST